MRIFVTVVLLVALAAWLWFFRPYGWFGQRIRFFGSAYQPPPVPPENPKP